MTNERHPVGITEKARESLKVLIAQKQLADAQLQAYVRGCYEAMELDGDWDLDTAHWTFNPRQETQK